MTDREKQEARFGRVSSKHGYLYFLEINGMTNKEGMLYKYVYVFDQDGKDITEKIAQVLNRKVSKSKTYHQAIFTTGYGFNLTDYLVEDIKNNSQKITEVL